MPGVEQVEQELIGIRCFEYVRVGYDHRKLELLPRCRIGRGRARLEQTWHLLEREGGLILAIAGDEGITCTLSRGANGHWCGRWRVYEQMPVELVPVPGAESAAPAPIDVNTREPIDVVYTWVDGADPVWQETRRRYADQDAARLPDQQAPRLYHDNDELRYSLRSIAAFAPWVRQIYLVTNGQVPAWLDTAQTGITIVPHHALFPDSRHLPTFSSHAIELHLHQIPGLANHYLYFNDDVLLGRPVSPNDFIDSNGVQRVYLESWCVPDNPDDGSAIDRAYAHTQMLLNDRSSPASRRSNREAIAHTPQMYRRDLMAEVQRVWEDAVARTSAHRFRSPDDVALRILYYHYALACAAHQRRHVTSTLYGHSAEYFLLRLDKDIPKAIEFLDELLFQRPKFICLNDELDDSEEARIIREYARKVLAEYYPHPCRFER